MRVEVNSCQGILKLWERIEIVVGEGTEAGHYIARIEDFSKQGIIISCPEMVSGNTLLRDNADCIVFFNREDAMYRLITRIRRDAGQPNRYVLRPLQEIQRVQRRQFVRVEMWQKMSFAVLPSAVGNASTAGSTLEWVKALCQNISGGGILMKTDRELTVDDVLILKCPLFDEIGLPEALVGVCRRVFKEKTGFLYGIEFILEHQIDQYVESTSRALLPKAVMHYDLLMQNKLVIFIFRQQLALRKKGLL